MARASTPWGRERESPGESARRQDRTRGESPRWECPAGCPQRSACLKPTEQVDVRLASRCGTAAGKQWRKTRKQRQIFAFWVRSGGCGSGGSAHAGRGWGGPGASAGHRRKPAHRWRLPARRLHTPTPYSLFALADHKGMPRPRWLRGAGCNHAPAPAACTRFHFLRTQTVR